MLRCLAGRIGAPRTAVQFFPAVAAKLRKRQGARLRRLLPEAIPGLEISRLELAPGGQMVGVPHTAGTREYLTCERGKVELTAGGQHWELAPGDSLVFRGDQKHSYRNPDGRLGAVAISVVCFAPVGS